MTSEEVISKKLVLVTYLAFCEKGIGEENGGPFLFFIVRNNGLHHVIPALVKRLDIWFYGKSRILSGSTGFFFYFGKLLIFSKMFSRLKRSLLAFIVWVSELGEISFVVAIVVRGLTEWVVVIKLASVERWVAEICLLHYGVASFNAQSRRDISKNGGCHGRFFHSQAEFD